MTDFSYPLTSFSWLLVLSGSYLIVLTVFTAYMKLFRNGKPFSLKVLSVIHNTLLSLFSLYCFYGYLRTLIVNFSASSSPAVTLLLCDAKHEMLQHMDYWWYLFYMSKYVEFIDSVFLVLRGKPVFPPTEVQYQLHVFHHLTTASIVWSCWLFPIQTSWIGPLTNTFVHIIMYAYYAATDLGLPRKFGLLITPIQLIQFVICIAWTSTEWASMAIWGWDACGTNAKTLGWVFFCYFVFLGMFYLMFGQKKKLLAGDAAAAKKKN